MILLLLIILIILSVYFTGGSDVQKVKLNAKLSWPELKDYPVIDTIHGDQVTLVHQHKAYDNNKLRSYPFIRNELTVSDLKQIISELRKEPLNYINKFNQPIHVDSDGKFKDQYITFVYNTEHNYTYIKLIDYFMEPCRVQCKRVNKSLTPMAWFNKNRHKIEKLTPKPITYDKLFETMYNMRLSICSEFNPLFACYIINYFKQNNPATHRMRVLDMSAGRGARMLGAILCDVDYVGVDPDSCLHKRYETMYKTYAAICDYKGSAVVHHSGFEDVKLTGEFDLMFSSPPYFDLEIFSKEPTQSISKFSSIDRWLNEFMYVSMKKIGDVLRPGGIMAINIDNPLVVKMDYVNPMLKFKFENMDYLGVIQILNNEVTNYSIWCWQKNIN